VTPLRRSLGQAGMPALRGSRRDGRDARARVAGSDGRWEVPLRRRSLPVRFGVGEARCEWVDEGGSHSGFMEDENFFGKYFSHPRLVERVFRYTPHRPENFARDP